MAANEGKTDIFGKPVRWYVDQAEWLFVGLALVISAAYVGSFWVEVSYVSLAAPLMFMLQVVTAVIVAYVVGIHRRATLSQTITIAAATGFGAGLVAALWAMVRFWYPWLILNIITEPVWSALLAGFVSALTIGFFSLPVLVDKVRAIFQPES